MSAVHLGQRILASAVVAGAALLWFGLLGRVAQIGTLYWKVGDPRVSAGTTSLVLFLLTSGFCASVGFLTARAAGEKLVARVAHFAAAASVAAGLAWLALVVSPLVVLVAR